jgi:hypothetical protein
MQLARISWTNAEQQSAMKILQATVKFQYMLKEIMYR